MKTRPGTDISIIIPTKNGGARFERVLKAVFSQNTRHNYEVIVIDSGSTDGTLDMLKKYPVRLHEIPPEEFGHARTRNLGARLARAEKYLVFLNHDAIPSDEEWLNNLVRSIEFEPDIKAACAAELTNEAEPFNVGGVAGFIFTVSNAKGVYIIEPYTLRKFSHLPKMRQRELFPFTTVCAIFNREHFEKYPFDENVEWAEDLYWAVENSNRGFKAACSILAKVYHYHEYNETEQAERNKHTAKVFKELFDLNLDDTRAKPKPSLGRLSRIFRKRV